MVSVNHVYNFHQHHQFVLYDHQHHLQYNDQQHNDKQHDEQQLHYYLLDDLRDFELLGDQLYERS